ncbi:MAG: NAD(P)H-binding protein [Verrucomicrobiia bacterium]
MIAITTPTGNIGSKILNRFLENKSRAARLLARNPAKLPPEAASCFEIVQGSMDDPAALRSLMDGADTLFWCQPDAPAAPDYVGAYEDLARLGAEAIHDAGVSRVVAVSAAGEPGDIPAGPITALHRMEEILAATGVAARFLRCGSFFENLLWQWDQILEEGSFTYPAPGDVPGPQVATADIAGVAADLLTTPDWTGQESIPLLGPKDLSFDEMAAILSEALRRTVRYQQSPTSDHIAAMQRLGQSESAAQGLVEMFTFLAERYSAPRTANRELTPTSFDQWLQRDL